jgi:murein L,D-transpeptidase YcbB/YkuD
MQFKTAATLLTLLSLLSSAINASALQPRAAGYCDTHRTINLNIQSGDYVHVYAFYIPAYGSSQDTDCLMNSGATGSGVSALQRTINWCYAPSKVLDVDGDYGPLTKAAVKVVQKKVGTTQDGIYGPKTEAAMKWVGFNGQDGLCRSLTLST